MTSLFKLEYTNTDSPYHKMFAILSTYVGSLLLFCETAEFTYYVVAKSFIVEQPSDILNVR